MKTIKVATTIIGRNSKILLVQRPTQSNQTGLWELAGGKVGPDESQRQALVCELNEEPGIEVTVGDYVANHQREVPGRIIHLHVQYIPNSHGTLQVYEHQALVWCSSEGALRCPPAPAGIPLLGAFMAPRVTRSTDQCLGFCHPVGTAAAFPRS